MDPVGKEISIRKLRAEDADEIKEIYGLITQTAVKEDFKALVKEHAVKEEHEAHFVADMDGKVMGFMISYILPFGFGAEKCAYIATMGVHPRHMGQGIGAMMSEEVFNFYKSQGVSRVYTSVRWDSTDLLSFCKKLGFERSEFINLTKRLG